MRLFKFIILLFVVAGFINCNPAAPLTPEESFLNVKNSFLAEDSVRLSGLMSESSIKNFNSMLFIIQKGDKKQLEYISKKYSITETAVKSLNLNRYISLLIKYEKKYPVIWKILQQKIHSIEKNGNSAKIYVENGMFLFFVKEGPYWKIDLTNM